MEIKKLENILQELHLALVNHECNERDIFAVNDPRLRTFGWGCRCGIEFSINTGKLQELNSQKYIPEIYATYLKTFAGRGEIAKMMNEGWIPEEWQ